MFERHRPTPSRPITGHGKSKADLHIHTTYSDGTLEPEDLLNYYSVFPDMRVIAITDHDTIDGALRVAEHKAEHPDLYDEIDVIIGEEITTRQGHVIGLFLDEWIPPDLSAEETIARIHAQRGLAIAAHPYTHLLRFTGLKGVGDLIRTLPFDAVESRNSNFTEFYTNLWTSWRSRGMAQVGSSDAHFLRAVGRCFTLFPGRTAAELRRAIETRQTRPGGRCYGIPTLAGYCLDQLRAGRALIPNRARSRHQPVGAELAMDVVADYERDTLWISVSGRLDARGGMALKQKVTRILEAGLHLVLDMNQVAWLDSAGITSLVAGTKCGRRCGTAFLLARPSPIVEGALRMARLIGVLAIVQDAAEARRQIAAHASGTIPEMALDDDGEELGRAA